MGDTLAMTDLVWKALAEPTRRAVLDALAKRPQTTGDLVQRFPGLCRTAVMKHLDVLEAAGLLIVQREGRVRWNHLNPVPIQRIHDRWVSRHVAGLASALSRLKEHVESPRVRARTAASSTSSKKTPRKRTTSARSGASTRKRTTSARTRTRRETAPRKRKPAA